MGPSGNNPLDPLLAATDGQAATFVCALDEAFKDTDLKQAHQVVRMAVAGGMPAETVLFQLVLPAVERMLRSAGEGCEVSLAQHFLTSQIASDVAGWLIPQFKTTQDSAGCVVLGTSAGDFHGLGKTIVSGCLRAHNFRVVDLGLNVSPEAFVDRALVEGASVIGISSMMVHTATGARGSRGVRSLLRSRGLEAHVRIIVGGAPYRHNPQLFRSVEADAWAEDGLAAAGTVRKLIQEVNS